MAIKEQQTQLMTSKGATYKTVDGVTYFKLKSEFEGDYTKHCGLLGEEIDENFYFLRGYDIETITVDENRNLVIERVDKDYEPIIIKIGEELGNPSFSFDRETGIVTIVFPDGSISKMEGFLIEGKDIRIATDSTFNGHGTVYNPLRLSPVDATGTFAPADEYFDLTNENNGIISMPIGKGKGYRVVTKEKIDNFGCLYPYSAVEKIQAKLDETKSQWRVATKEDWDDLLNATESAENRNHNSSSCTWLGKNAAVALKSYNLWEEDLKSHGDSVKGQDILGLSVYPLGITPDRNEVLNDKNNDAEGFGKITGMWTATKGEDGNAYAKIFAYNEGKVDQDTYGEGAKMSIRLVKDYAYSNYNEIETILGFPYPTEMVYGPKEDYPYVKIWTKINFYSDADNLEGVRSDEWEQVSESDRGVKIVYFINEWDGVEWHKKPMENGDSVVILEYKKGEQILPYHEWRIIDGDLVDTADALAIEFEDSLYALKQEIKQLSGYTENFAQEFKSFSSWTVNTINEFSAATELHIEKLNKNITEVNESVKSLSSATRNEISRIDNTIDGVSAATVNEVSRIDNAIDAVSAATNSSIARVNLTIENVSANTVENIIRIDNTIEAVSAATVNEVSRIDNAIDAVSAATVGEVLRIDNTIDGVSASTVNEVSRIDNTIEAVSAATVNEVTRIDETINAVSAATVEEINRIDSELETERNARIANDITPGNYVLHGDHSEMVIPSNGTNVEDVKIKISDDFFNFGTF